MHQYVAHSKIISLVEKLKELEQQISQHICYKNALVKCAAICAKYHSDEDRRHFIDEREKNWPIIESVVRAAKLGNLSVSNTFEALIKCTDKEIEDRWNLYNQSAIEISKLCDR